ncbi:MAG: TIGR00266 family protein [Candidatus Coatesbacteria bacterium]|nr:TIGR00266 family protein [Candidatus Coatesbacteria bacterium]
MQYDLLYRPNFTLAKVMLDPGERVTAEAGAMVSMSADIEMETKGRGGIGKSLLRSMVGGESFFQNHYTAGPNGGEVTFAPNFAGDIIQLQMAGNTIMAQSGAYIFDTGEIDIDTKFGGGKMFFSGERLFLLKLVGHGDVFLSAYGAVHMVELGDGEEYVVDTGHIVAFDESCDFKVSKPSKGLKSLFFSGEGFVCRFSGPGRVWLQTRNPAWLYQLMAQAQSR